MQAFIDSSHNSTDNLHVYSITSTTISWVSSMCRLQGETESPIDGHGPDLPGLPVWHQGGGSCMREPSEERHKPYNQELHPPSLGA